MSEFPAHPFWDFSLQTYGAEGVAPACLALQERHGVDVNFLFFCCYLATERGAVGAAEIARLHAAVEVWHEEIVKGLRAVRKRLKEPVAGENREVALSVRARIQKTEIDAEHLEQLMLADALAASEGAPPDNPKAAAEAALTNIADYFDLIGARASHEDHQHVETVVAAAVGSSPDRD